jgi:hypothetical protein
MASLYGLYKPLPVRIQTKLWTVLTALYNGLPRRLLDIRPISTPNAKLVDGRDATGPYLALSHFWRPLSAITKTTSSLAQLQAVVEWSDLIHVIRDAITAIRQPESNMQSFNRVHVVVCKIAPTGANFQLPSIRSWTPTGRAHLH